MFLEPRWAKYALIQNKADAGSIACSDAKDVQLDRLLDEIETETAPDKPIDLERAVKSYARRERSRHLSRRLTEHAFAPKSLPDPEQMLAWKQRWKLFEQAFAPADFQLLVRSETVMREGPLTGAERTRICRVRSSATYRAARAVVFARVA